MGPFCNIRVLKEQLVLKSPPKSFKLPKMESVGTLKFFRIHFYKNICFNNNMNRNRRDRIWKDITLNSEQGKRGRPMRGNHRSRGKSHLYCLLIFWLFGFAESQFPLNNRGSNNESSYFLRAYHVPITKAFRQVLYHSVTTEACMANPITTLPPNLQMRRLREREAHWIVWGHRHQMSLATGLPHQQPSWACWHIFGEGSPSISPHSHASVIVTSVVPKRWLMDSLLTSSPSYS